MLAPMIAGRSRWLDGAPAVLNPRWATVHALLLDAAARDQLGDSACAEASIERALELAEPDGMILQFTLAPVRGLLERHPRHRTAHATLLSTILDVLAGSAPPRRAATPLRDELSDAELRVMRYLPSNLKAPEIAAELFVSANTGQDAPAPHLRQARRPQPQRGGGPRPRARAARTRALAQRVERCHRFGNRRGVRDPSSVGERLEEHDHRSQGEGDGGREDGSERAGPMTDGRVAARCRQLHQRDDRCRHQRGPVRNDADRS